MQQPGWLQILALYISTSLLLQKYVNEINIAKQKQDISLYIIFPFLYTNLNLVDLA